MIAGFSAPANSPRWHQAALAVAAVIVGGVPLLLGWNGIVNHFMVSGGYLQDTGWEASLIYHNALLPLNPPAITGGFYFRYHFAPVLMILSGLSYLFPVGHIDYLGVYSGLTRAGLSVTLFALLAAVCDARTLPRIAAAAAVSLLFAFNGFVLAAILYPNETLFATGAVMFFALLATDHPRAAALPFAFTLLGREDSGFHLVAVLGLWLAYAVLVQKRPWATFRPAALYVAAAFLYSAGALAIQHAYFPGDFAFRRVYLGEPAYAHLNWELLAHRLYVVAYQRQYLGLPLLFIAGWAWATRRPALLLGYAAYVPWLLLHLGATYEQAGTLVAHYMFPFIVSLAWPVLCLVWTDRPALRGRAGRRMLALQAAALLLSLVGYGRLGPLPGMVRLEPAPRAAIAQLQAALAGPHADWGRVMMDGSVAALDPWHVPAEQVLRSTPQRGADLLLYFETGPFQDDVRRYTEQHGLRHRYRYANTNVRFAALSPLPASVTLGALLHPLP